MKKKMIAAVMAAAMITSAAGATPVSPALFSAPITASAASVADYQGNYSVPVTLINATTGGTSMGNAALNPTGTVVVDSNGKASIKLEFHSLTYLRMDGYLGFFRKVTDAGPVNADVLEEYTGIYDDFNTPGGEYEDTNVSGRWYPKVVSIPIDVKVGTDGKLTGTNGTDVNVQVYVSVMESINTGSGTQPAILRINWDQLTKKESNMTGSQLSVSGDITMKNYIEVDNALLNDSGAKIVTEVGGITNEVSLNSLTNTENGLAVPVNVPARHMTSNVTVEVQNGSGETVDSYTVNVKEYALKIVYGNYTDKQKKMAKALLNYGAYAQKYFDTNTKKLANADLAESDQWNTADLNAVSFNDYGYTTVGNDGAALGARYMGSCLSLVSEPAIKHYFKANSLDGLTFTVNGKPFTPIYDEAKNQYWVAVTGISAADLAKKYDVVVSKGTTSYTLSYSVMDYCKAAQSAETTKNNTDLLNLTKAIYLFYDSAK